MPDLKYRYLAEDVPTGLCFTRGLAELLEVPTPTIDKAEMRLVSEVEDSEL